MQAHVGLLGLVCASIASWALSGCGPVDDEPPVDPSSPGVALGDPEGGGRLADSKALRAAAIAATQRDAAANFWARSEVSGLVANAGHFEVRYDEVGAGLEVGGRRAGRIALASLGCVGGVDAQRASRAEPQAVRNRVTYSVRLGEVAVEAWYSTGPLGLEHGFTIADAPACAREGGELEIVVEASGFVARPTPRGASLLGARGERLAYTDLLAKDAGGRTLPSRMQVAAPDRIALLVDTVGATWPIEIDPLVWDEVQKLVASDGGLNDQLGLSIAIDGDTAVVGAPLSTVGLLFGQGSAYVFTRTNGLWVESQKLVASDGSKNDWFGYSVALRGDDIVVGAIGDGPNSVGAAYVFARQNGTWVEQQKLAAADMDVSTFGFSAALQNDTALIGAYGWSSAHVFVRSNGIWTEQQKLVASDREWTDGFGHSVALRGDTALIGAVMDDVGTSTNQGSASVFVRSGGVWTEQQKLVASDGELADGFGAGVALSGTTAIVGAINGDAGPITDTGAAYVYELSNGVWTEQQKLVATDGATNDLFGFSVALSGDLAIIGARQDDVGMTADQGSAYLFVRENGAWSERQRFTASNGAPGDNFSVSIATDGQTALVGADLEGPFPSAARGAVYAYVLNGGLGNACSMAGECESGFCVDGVCCDTSCGEGLEIDCLACSTATGAAVDGLCGPSDGTPCDDGNACSTPDLCIAGLCEGAPVGCDDGNDCTMDGCNPASGCVHANQEDGFWCSDANACTSTDRCEAGTCVGTTPTVCSDDNECTADVCDPATGCAHAPIAEGLPCEGGRCANGQCDPAGAGVDDASGGGGPGDDGGPHASGGTGDDARHDEGRGCRISGSAPGVCSAQVPSVWGAWLAAAIAALGVRRRRKRGEALPLKGTSR
jgi:hypothetical protein